MEKNITIAALVIAVLILGGFLLTRPVQVIQLGASPGPTIVYPVEFLDAVTIKGTAKVSQGSTNGSSTIQIGNTLSGVGPGCLVLGDSAGTTSTPVYITATGTTVSATTTKPAICK